MDERVGWVRDAAGDHFEQLDLSVLSLVGRVTITHEPLKAAAAVARELETRTGLTIEPEDVLESPYSLIGSVPDLVGKLRRARERWGIKLVPGRLVRRHGLGRGVTGDRAAGGDLISADR